MNTFGTSLELVLPQAARHDDAAFARDGRSRAIAAKGRKTKRGRGWWSNAVCVWGYHGRHFPSQ
jgi:hypothetical protein